MTVSSISHLIQPWLLPPGLICLLILLGLFTCIFSRTAGIILIFFALVLLWLLSAPAFTYSFINLLQNQYPILPMTDLKAPSGNYAIVILGGGDMIEAEYNNKRTVSDFTLHRVNYAAFLQQKLHLPIIVSGGKSPSSDASEAELMAETLNSHFNIKADYIENASLNTADESRLVLSLIKQHKLYGIYLVTHAWHMPRSVYIFKCAGINVIPAPMGHYVYGPGYALISFLPNMEALYASALAMHEYIGLVWYHLYYGAQCKK